MAWPDAMTMTTPPLLRVERLEKRKARGWAKRQTTFSLEADFEIGGPTIVGVMGANGAGKTTLFELTTGSNLPTAGRVLVAGQDIHEVRSFTRTRPNFMLEHAGSEGALVHLFDEPRFNTQDGYNGFMLDFFRKLRGQGKLVFLCLHPNEPVHLDILADVCERFIFVHKDEGTSRLMQAGSLPELTRNERVRRYLGRLAPAGELGGIAARGEAIGR